MRNATGSNALGAMSELKGKKALVVGLAATGLSVSRFLARRGALVSAYDSKPAGAFSSADELRALGVNILTGEANATVDKDAELVIVSPGVPYDNAILVGARERGARVISEIELAFDYMDAPVVAIAGTNGKTTTTELIGEIFKRAGRKTFVGGNIGTPAI